MTAVPILRCTRCQAEMVSMFHHKRSGFLRQRYARQAGRGLCQGCYNHERDRGRLGEYERTNRPADELLDEWARLRAEGHTWRQAAPRLGVTEHALEGALCRAKRRGDPRGCRTLTELHQQGRRPTTVPARERTPWGQFQLHPTHLTTGPIPHAPGTPEHEQALRRRATWAARQHTRPDERHTTRLRLAETALRLPPLTSTAADLRTVLDALGLLDRP